MSDIIFKIGPRINASGRMESGRESVDLLVERDLASALLEAKHIDKYNDKRKDVDRQMTEEANQIVERLESQKHQNSIVLYDEHWKKELWYCCFSSNRNLLSSNYRYYS